MVVELSPQETDLKNLPLPRRLAKALQYGDLPYRWLLLLMSILVIVAMVAIGIQLWENSALSRAAFGWNFLFTADWDPVQEQFGALAFIEGTILTSLVALIFAIPPSLGIALFLSELAPPQVRNVAGFLVESLATVPSVVYGLWGLFIFIPSIVRPLGEFLSNNLGFIPLFTGPIYGPSRLAASMLLAIMILPTISAVSRDVFVAIPRSQREAALAMGATRWEVISQILVPYGLSGIVGAIILGLGRALGETLAVTMVIGNNLDLTASLLHPGYTMAAVIANEFTEATYDLYLQSLIEVGLLLFGITLIVNIIARVLVLRIGRIR